MKSLLGWSAAFFAAAIVFTFLHECGHGFGARLDGVSVSTGFSRVGMPDRSPGDDDFRTGLIIPGTLTSGFLLGPMVNWLSPAVATVLLVRVREFGPKARLAPRRILSRRLPHARQG